MEVCHQIILEDALPKMKSDGSIPSPKEIKQFLDLYVIGQHHAKTVLSVAVHNHYKRLENPIIDDVEIEKSNVLLMGPTGVGKAQPLHSQILTDIGWKNMGDIIIGDKVVTPSGEIARVSDIFPQGKKPIYSIKFVDGRVAESCDEHLWEVYNKHWRNKWKIMSLKEIIEWKRTRKGDLYIRLVKPREMEDVELPIDPYVMGCLLGDGYFNNGHIQISNSDEELLNKFENRLIDGYKLDYIGGTDYGIKPTENNKGKKGHSFRKNNFINLYKKYLFEMDLYGKLSDKKFIPEIYKNSSVKQKIKLLQGLVDTDGEARGCLLYSTVSEQLAYDMQDMIWSLGGICKIKKSSGIFYTYRGEKRRGKDSYHLTIRYPNMRALTSLSRKTSRLSENYQYKDLKLRVDKIEYVGDMNAQCIMIDHPEHLYITDNYITTHNTLLARTIAKMLDVPFAIADATSLTEAGYVGDDVENIIVKLYQVSDGDVEKCQRGIVYVDEIDKLARRGDSASITRDVGGEGVQQSLLKILEGSTCRFPPEGGRKHPNQEMIEVDTTNILFIVGGAFVGLDKVIEARKSTGSSIGYGAKIVGKVDEHTDLSHLLYDVEPKDLHRFGLIPEFVGRIPVRAALKELSEDEMMEILTKPKNALCKQYQKMFGLEKIILEFTDESLKHVSKNCIKDKTGARGLRSVLEKNLLQLQYDLPELHGQGVTKITINKDFIVNGGEPLMLYNGKENDVTN